MTQNDLAGRIAEAAAGTRIVYHTGSLMFDRKRGLGFLAAEATALVAFAAMERGEVQLVQRKLGTQKFEYIAVKLPAPHVPVQWEGCYYVDKYLNPPKRTRPHRDNDAMASFVASAQATRAAGAPTAPHA